MVLNYLGRPGFLTGYIAQSPAPRDADTAVAELMAMLGKAGITSETGLKNIAA